MGIKHIRAAALALMMVFSVLCALPAAAGKGQEPITSAEQLNRSGIRIGVGTGSAAMMIAEKELPNADIVYLNDHNTAYEALAQGKIDAFVFDRIQMQLAIDSGLTGVHLLDGNMKESVHIAVGISPASRIPDLMGKINAFIAEKKADGTLDDMYDRWVIRREETMPEIAPADNPQYRLKVGTTGIAPPYTYYKGTELTGYDIELAFRFAAWIGAEVSFQVYDYGAIITATAAGDVDCAMANLNVTSERKEAMPFSDDLYEEQIAVMVRGNATAGSFSAIKDLNGKRIGVQTGTTFDTIVLEVLPDVKISYFNTYSDMAAALEAKKIDAFPGDEPVLRLMAAQDNELKILDDHLDSFEFGFVLSKTPEGEKLRDELNEWIARKKATNELDQIIREWTDATETEKTLPDYQHFPAPNGTLTLITAGDYAPMNYFRGQELVGAEIDLAARFCEDYGYGLKVTAVNFDGILPAVQAGKADFAAAGITVTEERKESVLFSDPYYTGGTMMIVLKTDAEQAADAGISPADGITESFHKTFIREGRWRLFAEGIGNTLLITVLSLICGTMLGFRIFMTCRKGNRIANGVTKAALWLIQGTPAVVLLMVLYYIVFGSLAISGLAVAVVGFTLTFGASVFGLLKMGVGAVDNGQYEAARALGYSDRRTFFRIILPQALPHVTPAYRGEVTGLIKGTSIVGYIAVQDLTKMGDIVRSRTYEAFFPLIAVTVIYFVLEFLFGFLIRRLDRLIDPKHRKPERILKGVKTEKQA